MRKYYNFKLILKTLMLVFNLISLKKKIINVIVYLYYNFSFINII